MNLKHPFLALTVGLVASLNTLSAHAQLSKTEALAKLTPQAIAKVKAGQIDLNELLTNDANDLIIEYSDGNVTTAKTLSATAKTFKIAELKKQVRDKLSNREYVVLRDYKALPYSFDRISGKSSLVALLNDPTVKAVYPNKKYTTQLTQSLGLIKQPQALSLGYGGEGTTVVVLDTGVDYTRSAFGSCSAPNSSTSCRVVAAFDTAANDNQLDDNGHGTNVSGIVAGVAAKTKIAGIDVFTGGGAYDADIIAGLNWALNNATALNIKAVNMSLGSSIRNTSTCTNSYTTVFANLRNAGIAPVVASGNDNYTNGVATPACTAGAIAVGAVYDTNVGGLTWGKRPNQCTDSTTYADKVTCFSNSHSTLLTLLAPGALITAAGITQGGTSQAAPHVAGAIAVLRAANASPNDTVTQTVNRLISTGTPVTDTRNGVVKPRIDLLAAVSAL